MADRIDGDGRDAVFRHRAGDLAHGSTFLLLLTPWPTIATGQPVLGIGPDGRNRLKYISLVPCTSGVPLRVPTAGMYSPRVDFIVRRQVLAECNARDRTRVDAQQREVELNRRGGK